jgi:ribosomal protein S18 acetylase RimI-like enzyme
VTLTVRHVRAGEQERLKAIRLAALTTDPDAFGSTRERDAARPQAWWDVWAAASADGSTQRTFVVTATTDDRWSGLALMRLRDEDPRLADLLAMWVAPEVRGRGAGRALCDACAAWAAQRGATELRLGVVVDNHRARRAYEAAGFAVTGRSTWSRDGRSFDQYTMTRRL